jgi:hypothetical protein
MMFILSINVEGYSVKDKGIKIKVFKIDGKGKKIEIPKRELEDTNGVLICQCRVQEYIDRIEIDGIENGTPYLTVRDSYDGTLFLQSREDPSTNCYQNKPKYVFQLYPWIGSDGNGYNVEVFIKDDDGCIKQKIYQFMFYFFNCNP